MRSQYAKKRENVCRKICNGLSDTARNNKKSDINLYINNKVRTINDIDNQKKKKKKTKKHVNKSKLNKSVIQK